MTNEPMMGDQPAQDKERLISLAKAFKRQGMQSLEQIRAFFQSSGTRYTEYHLRLARAMADRLEPIARRQLAQHAENISFDQAERILEQEGLVTLEQERQNLIHAARLAYSAQYWEWVIGLAESLANFFDIRSLSHRSLISCPKSEIGVSFCHYGRNGDSHGTDR